MKTTCTVWLLSSKTCRITTNDIKMSRFVDGACISDMETFIHEIEFIRMKAKENDIKVIFEFIQTN